MIRYVIFLKTFWVHVRHYIILYCIVLYCIIHLNVFWVSHCMILLNMMPRCTGLWPLPCSILSRFLHLVNLPAKMVLVRVAEEVPWDVLHRNVFSLYLKVLWLETGWESLWLHCICKSHRKGRKASKDLKSQCSWEYSWNLLFRLISVSLFFISLFKGKAHLKMNILWSFTHFHFIPKLYDFLSFAERKRSYLEECSCCTFPYSKS